MIGRLTSTNAAYKSHQKIEINVREGAYFSFWVHEADLYVPPQICNLSVSLLKKNFFLYFEIFA